MANWKKIATSGSKVEFDHITGSVLQLTNVDHSSNTTPLVIDSDGNVTTGSKYALASGGNTVGGSNLTSNVAIVGNGGSLIKSASSTSDVNFNSSSIFNITEITSSQIEVDGIHFKNLSNGSGSGKTITLSPEQDLKIGYNTTGIKTIHLMRGITGSVIPTKNLLPFYLGVSSSGEFIKIDRSNVEGGGTSTVTGLTEGTNIDITGTSTTEELLIAENLHVGNFSLTASINGNVLDEKILNGTISASNSVRVKFLSGFEQDFVIQSTTASGLLIDSISACGVTLNQEVSSSEVGTEKAMMFKLVNTITNATVALENDISLTSVSAVSITASGDISSSGTITAHTITASGVQITGDLDADGNIALDGTLSFNGFNFVDSSITVTSGSTIAGSGSNPSTTTHQFTGSVLITGSNLTLVDGTITAPSFSGDGSSLTNISATSLPSGLISSSDQILLGTNIVSSSTQTIAHLIGSGIISGNLANQLPSGVVSSSSQIDGTQITNNSITIAGTSTSLGGSITLATITNGSGIISGTLASQLPGGTISSSVEGDNQGQIKLNGVNVNTKDLGTDDSPTFSGLSVTNNVTIGGNLTVEGATTTISTQDLVVEDRFIVIGSGSDDSYDVGLIFDSGSTDTSNRAFYYDASQQRFATAKNIDHISDPQTIDETSANYTGDIVTVKTNQSTSPSNASSSFGEGEMYIDNNNDIWVYVE